MKTNKIVGLLLAGAMFISSLPVFAAAASTVSVDKVVDKGIPEYELGETVTITTDELEAIKVFDKNDNLLVWGVSELSEDGVWQYVLKLPETTENLDEDGNPVQNSGFWKDNATYTVFAGDDNSKDSCQFKIAKSDDDGDESTSNDGKITIKFVSTTAKPKTYKKLVSFVMKDRDADEEAYIDVKITKNGTTQKIGTAYTLKYAGKEYDEDESIETTVGKINSNSLSFWFKSTGTYKVTVTVTAANGDNWSYTKSVKVSNSTGGGGSTGGSTNLGGTTWIPGITGANTASGINVQLNPSQLTESGVQKTVAYSAGFKSTDSFWVGVAVDGVALTKLEGYDPVYVKVPYTTNITDTTTLVVKDANGNIIPRSFYKDGYMYVNVKDLTTTYTIVNNPKSFADVHHDWAVTQINALAAREIINGVGDNLFDPDRAVTRAEFTKMIITMFNVYDPTAVSTFADIDNSQWYAPYVATAQKLAVTNGYAEDNTFRPNQIISREEMSAMLYRAAEVLSVDVVAKVSQTTFNDDASIQEYAKVPVYKMQQAGVLQGVGANLFDPQGTCTRAQAAVAMYNMFVLSMTK